MAAIDVFISLIVHTLALFFVDTPTAWGEPNTNKDGIVALRPEGQED
jgi:hypothetical protein